MLHETSFGSCTIALFKNKHDEFLVLLTIWERWRRLGSHMCFSYLNSWYAAAVWRPLTHFQFSCFQQNTHHLTLCMDRQLELKTQQLQNWLSQGIFPGIYFKLVNLPKSFFFFNFTLLCSEATARTRESVCEASMLADYATSAPSSNSFN